MSPLIDAVQNSSSDIIHEAASRLRTTGRFPSQRWLSSRNRYAKQTIDQLKKDQSLNLISRYKNQLAEYIAASTIIHCADGWNFFSCAIDALLNQDTTSAIFMAYYAELRAVMAFFANEGIGIFNDKHYWFNSAGDVDSFSGRTHKVANDLIQSWAIYSPKNTRMLDLMQFDGKSFNDWLSAANLIVGSPAVSGLAKDWLKTWSIDLDIFSKDHNIRNEVSYRPQCINVQSQEENFQQYLHFLIEIWRSSEPSQANSFNLLDQHLLRNTLEGFYQRRTGQKPKGRLFTAFVTAAAVNLGISPNSNLVNFLTASDISNYPLVLTVAERKGQLVNGNMRALPVISRALLLLRLSSASAQNLIKATGIQKEELKFWWKSNGDLQGLWNPVNYPDRMIDLWADIEEAIDSLETWCEDHKDTCNICNSRIEKPIDFWYLRQFQRVGLWATGL